MRRAGWALAGALAGAGATIAIALLLPEEEQPDPDRVRVAWTGDPRQSYLLEWGGRRYHVPHRDVWPFPDEDPSQWT